MIIYDIDFIHLHKRIFLSANLSCALMLPNSIRPHTKLKSQQTLEYYICPRPILAFWINGPVLRPTLPFDGLYAFTNDE